MKFQARKSKYGLPRLWKGKETKQRHGRSRHSLKLSPEGQERVRQAKGWRKVSKRVRSTGEMGFKM